MEVACVLVRDSYRARGEVASDARTQLDGRAVRGDGDRLPVADLAALRVLRCELNLRLRPLELQLGRTLDRGAREERAVGDQPETRSPGTWFAARAKFLSFRLGGTGWKGCPLSDLGEGDPAEALRR